MEVSFSLGGSGTTLTTLLLLNKHWHYAHGPRGDWFPETWDADHLCLPPTPPLHHRGQVCAVEIRHEALPEALPGNNVGFNVKRVFMKDIYGNVAGDSKNNLSMDVGSFMALVSAQEAEGLRARGVLMVAGMLLRN